MIVAPRRYGLDHPVAALKGFGSQSPGGAEEDYRRTIFLFQALSCFGKAHLLPVGFSARGDQQGLFAPLVGDILRHRVDALDQLHDAKRLSPIGV